LILFWQETRTAHEILTSLTFKGKKAVLVLSEAKHGGWVAHATLGPFSALAMANNWRTARERVCQIMLKHRLLYPGRRNVFRDAFWKKGMDIINYNSQYLIIFPYISNKNYCEKPRTKKVFLSGKHFFKKNNQIRENINFSTCR